MTSDIKARALPDTAENVAVIHEEIMKGTAEGYISYTDPTGSNNFVVSVKGSDPARLLPDAMQLFVPIAEEVGKQFNVELMKDSAGHGVVAMQWL